MGRDWVAWHEPYSDPASSLARRLSIVQTRIRHALDAAAPGPIRVISFCAGQGRDLLGVLPDHPRRADVRARLVELDERNVAVARHLAADARLDAVEIVCADAASAGAYAGMVPAELVLVCGVFGNVSDGDIRTTIDALPSLCSAGATVIWTRHRASPDLTPTIRTWFGAAGFGEVAFDSDDGFLFGVGTHCLVREPLPFRPGVRLFTFVGDGRGANL